MCQCVRFEDPGARQLPDVPLKLLQERHTKAEIDLAKQVAQPHRTPLLWPIAYLLLVRHKLLRAEACAKLRDDHRVRMDLMGTPLRLATDEVFGSGHTIASKIAGP